MTKKKRIGFFVTCLVDSIRPEIGFACLNLLESQGFEVVVPELQTCCGQPALNSGDTSLTKKLARQIIETFHEFDFVVAPSGSCLATITKHYGELFADDPATLEKHAALQSRCYEILTFLDTHCDLPEGVTTLEATATYHDTCSGLRELSIYDAPRRLLSKVTGLRMVPLRDHDTCCGFGGTFCVKYSDISNAIVTEKANRIVETEADILLAADLGCLMNISGKLSRTGSSVRCYHPVEILAGLGNQPAICHKY